MIVRSSVIAVAIVVSTSAALAEDPRFCQLYARSYIEIAIAHNRTLGDPEYTTDQLAYALSRTTAMCVTADIVEPLMPAVAEASDEAWIKRTLLDHATPLDVGQAARTWCRANFRSYSGKNGGTVSLYGHRRRSSCPELYATCQADPKSKACP